MTDIATIRTVEHQDASDLPEINWFWRRVFIFTVTGVCLAHVWWTSNHITDVETLRNTVRNDQLLIALFALLYIAGASSEAITRLVGAVRTTRKETVAEGTSPAVVTPERVETPAAHPTSKPSGVDPTQYGGPRG